MKLDIGLNIGQIDGIIQKSDKIFVESKNVGKKNETSIQEQAIKEATSIWKKKKITGGVPC